MREFRNEPKTPRTENTARSVAALCGNRSRYTVNGEKLDVFFASFAHSLANFAVKKKENLTARFARKKRPV